MDAPSLPPTLPPKELILSSIWQVDASVEMGLSSPGWENLLDFIELRQVLSTYDGDLRDLLWWPQERPFPMRVARGPLVIPLPSMPGPKTLCGVGVGN